MGEIHMRCSCTREWVSPRRILDCTAMSTGGHASGVVKVDGVVHRKEWRWKIEWRCGSTNVR